MTNVHKKWLKLQNITKWYYRIWIILQYRWFRMQQHDWSSANPKEPMSHLSLSSCTGSRLQLASSSRHWCLHIEQPQAQHPPISTHWWQSTFPEICKWATPRGAITERHKITSFTVHFIHRFHSPFLAGGMNFPPPSRTLNPWQFSSDTWKLISFDTNWLPS